MSGALRKQLRQSAEQALATLTGFKAFSAWQQVVDASSLPGWAVATPNSRHVRQDNFGTTEQQPMLLVIVKRTGAPDRIENALDEDADAIAPLILAAIKTDAIDCELVETAMRVDRSGAEPVGTLTLQFQITSYF
jgi:hypothetical protein